MMQSGKSLWLVGAGGMARTYCKVLQNLGQDFAVIGRGTDSAMAFEAATGLSVLPGGVEGALSTLGAPVHAIVAVGAEQLARVASRLIEAGTSRLMVEKPGGLTTQQIGELAACAHARSADVLIAYNRRFYAAAAAARQLITADGGATSCSFEFTERAHLIGPQAKAPGIKESLFLNNSTHVVDLAFHLCGFPAEWRAWHGGSLSWHPASARFCGAGMTDRGVFFSYFADWEAPGRWGLEVMTRKSRLIFRPMEQLQVMTIGASSAHLVALDDSLDAAFKPGVFAQTKAFLDHDDQLFCTVEEQFRHCAIYDAMAGYGEYGNADEQPAKP